MSRLFSYENTSPIYEGYEGEAGILMAHAEAYEDMLPFHESLSVINSLQLSLEATTDSNMVSVLEGNIGEKFKHAINIIIENIKKFWGRVKGIFKKNKEDLSKRNITNEQFFKKYLPLLRQAASKKKMDSFEMEMYEYPYIKSAFSDLYDEIRKVQDIIKKNRRFLVRGRAKTRISES